MFQQLPLFADDLREDSYFSVHGMAISGKRSVTLAGVEELAWAIRNEKNADFLTSAFLDFDCYHAGLTAGEGLGRLVDAENEKILPPVSAYLLSGRGVWAYWLLDDGAGRVPKTGDTARRIWAGIERELVARARGLGVGLDEKCIDLARVCRLPGSVNSKADDGFGDTVRFLWQTDAGLRLPVYTLDELADILGVRSWLPRIITGGAGEKKPGRSSGYRAQWQKKLWRLDALQMYRGGYWHKGHRNNALFLLALFLRKTGHPGSLIRETVERAGLASGLDLCEASEIARKIERLDVYQKISDEKIRAWLGVTDDEAAAIGWEAPGRDWSKDARDAMTANKADRIGNRRALVREYVRKAGADAWTLRTLGAWLEQETGKRPADGTILADLAALGLATPAARAKQAQGQLAL